MNKVKKFEVEFELHADFYWSSWRIKGNDSTTRVFLGLNPDDSLVIHEILDSRHDVIVVQNDPVLFRASGSQPTP